jgi:hypothetical protein
MSSQKPDENNPKTVNFWPGSPLSYTTTKITCFFGETILGDATGYIHRFANRIGLVTNWHVITGRSPINGQPLNAHGGVPNRIRFHAAVEINAEGEQDLVHFREFDLDLYTSNDEQLWLGAKDDSNQIDIAIVPMDGLVPEIASGTGSIRGIEGGKVTLSPATNPAGPLKFDDLKHFLPKVGSEVFVLGYPKGITPSGIFPIWKRASIASEPQVGITLGDVNYEDAFYIDALTNQGMSGSPVVHFPKAGDYLFTKDNIAVVADGKNPFLVGVYAGRNGVTNMEGDLALGRVWGVSLIERLFASPAYLTVEARRTKQAA